MRKTRHENGWNRFLGRDSMFKGTEVAPVHSITKNGHSSFLSISRALAMWLSSSSSAKLKCIFIPQNCEQDFYLALVSRMWQKWHHASVEVRLHESLHAFPPPLGTLPRCHVSKSNLACWSGEATEQRCSISVGAIHLKMANPRTS